MITEVEAYHEKEPACHAYRGKTPRNQTMFQEGGVLYVYFIYGMHYCINVVTEKEGIGSAVLIRSLEPIEGIEKMKELYGKRISLRDLLRGPGRITRALGIDKRLDGHLLTKPPLWISSYKEIPSFKIQTSPRRGISKAQDLLWRFFIEDSSYVS